MAWIIVTTENYPRVITKDGLGYVSFSEVITKLHLFTPIFETKRDAKVYVSRCGISGGYKYLNIGDIVSALNPFARYGI